MKEKGNPIILIICDGLGHRRSLEYNAVASARTPNLTYFWKKYPAALLAASGEAVGLPEGQMGTSEANHLIIGSGRIIYQNLIKINQAVKDKTMAQNKAIQEAFNHVKKYQSVLHIKGVASPGGVHGHIDHIKFFLETAKKENIKNVMLHLFTDGRDTPPKSALNYIGDLEKFAKRIGIGKIASVGGRYWGMDRDNNLDRIEKHFQVIVKKSGPKFKSAGEIVKEAYKNGVVDEFIEPALVEIGKGEYGCIQSNDAVIFTNFRADRARELTKRFVEEKIENLNYVAMAKYDDDLDIRVAFPPEEIKNTLSEVLSANDKRQLRVTETEKFTHLTFFFNAQRYAPDKGEDRIMIPSEKVRSHDEKPEMKAFEIAQRVKESLSLKKYDFIAVNLVNCDMVAHTGNFKATIRAVHAVDKALRQIVEAGRKNNAEIIITADHGNAEQTFDKKVNQPMTAHTLNPVPFILISKRYEKINRNRGLLSDIAPTILKMFDLPIPKEITGRSFI